MEMRHHRPFRFSLCGTGTWCGLHGSETLRDWAVELLDLTGADGKTYRAGQCQRCSRVFWGIHGEPWHADCRYLGICAGDSP
jgi:hypothetical protein